MKKIAFIVVAVFISTLTFSQKKERVKGSKIVTIAQKEVQDFTAIEVQDNLEIFLIKGDKNGVELEADDNLHDAIDLKYNGGTLILSSAQDILGFKKFTIRVIYTDELKTVEAKNKAKIHGPEEINLEEVTFKSFENSKMFLNVNVKALTIVGNDKSEIQLNAKSESVKIELSKNSEMKALISSTEIKFDMYQKSKATIEGDVIDLKLRFDNNSNFIGKNLNAKNCELVAEGYSNATLLVETSLNLDATGSSEIYLYGEPKIELAKFTDNATLYKKSLK
ncbi:hypothetical protein J2X31_002005 [Flavobacterium arsenatis]|uniref:Putative auto-transporter adhesin head GIN domain-containing protein n=1 Tax=Flavobacterium arsenatis TaxID=1484332 RepID=A0ABU1TQ10_9FLAO|nr:DUF2807 domain-containing protein [Flavobacterium arsenatis]MDR6967991.1 hypothetical protein [Flavobacterium arsenatis]